MCLAIIILAAGKGGRLQTEVPKEQRVPKALFKLRGKAMVSYVLKATRKLSPTKIFIVHPEGREADFPQGKDITLLQGGKGYLCDMFGAVRAASGYDTLVVVNADAAVVSGETLLELLSLLDGVDFVWPGVDPTVCLPEKSVRFIPGEKRMRRPNALVLRPGEIRFGPRLRFLLWLMQVKVIGHVGEGLVAIGVIGFFRSLSCLRFSWPTEAIADLIGRMKGHAPIIPDLDPGEFARRIVGFYLPSWKLAELIGLFLGCRASIPMTDLWELVADVDYQDDVHQVEKILAAREMETGG